MGRFRRHMYAEFSQQYSNDERFNAAYRKVKRIKGFYSHLKVYIIVNIIIIASNFNGSFFGHGVEESGFFSWHTYSTAVFWGIGLVAHALSVFGKDIFFSEDWEQRKIQQYMDKDAANNKWE